MSRLRDSSSAVFPATVTFFTESEIADLRPTRNADLLQRIPGVRVVTKRGGWTPGKGIAVDSTFVVRGGRAAFDENRATCRLDVIVDGVRRRPEDLESIAPSSIRALEVHDASSMPAQFPGSVCGAVMLWTKR